MAAAPPRFTAGEAEDGNDGGGTEEQFLFHVVWFDF